ncbi:RagB/SusD family nutrient uptake outer membrane protein [Bacteroides reticulotermitis]|nr:RagB/SusD family nutrient uptake outer membrane protein [Bacteroides reticulotermitis]MBB4043645.1 hypothetical protein [Bacteroides reticulotermitis]
MKKIFFIAVGLLTLTFSSCDFLDTEVYGNLDEHNLYRDQASCMAGLAGIYDKLGAKGTYGLNIWGDLDAGTDIMVYNREYGKKYIQLPNYNYNNTSADLEQSWKDLYEGINRANDYIGLLSQRTDEECGGETKKNMYLAEAKALRALYYMNLVAFWGDVPLRLEVVRDLSQQQLKRSPQAKIYEQIIEDLLDAEKGCRPADELNAPGRISKTTAQALLARTYMWRSGYPMEMDNWEEALNYARKVRDSKLHELYQSDKGVDGYRSMFINMCSNKYDLNHKESMFEVEFYGNGLDKSNESGYLGLYLGIMQGVQTDQDVPFAYAWFDGSRILMKMYENNDVRKWWNFGDYKYELVNNKVTKTMFTEMEKLTKTDGNPGKWRAEYDPVRPWARNNSSINYPIMRYADVLLMIAESANEFSKNPTQEAIDAVNLVRERAGASKVSLGDFAGAEEFREFIREERARELCFEVPRRMELRRWGKQYYIDRIRLLSEQAKDENGSQIGYDVTSVKAVPGLNVVEKHLYFPIPQAELNTNPTCGQNPNW